MYAQGRAIASVGTTFKTTQLALLTYLNHSLGWDSEGRGEPMPMLECYISSHPTTGGVITCISYPLAKKVKTLKHTTPQFKELLLGDILASLTVAADP